MRLARTAPANGGPSSLLQPLQVVAVANALRKLCGADTYYRFGSLRFVATTPLTWALLDQIRGIPNVASVYSDVEPDPRPAGQRSAAPRAAPKKVLNRPVWHPSMLENSAEHLLHRNTKNSNTAAQAAAAAGDAAAGAAPAEAAPQSAAERLRAEIPEIKATDKAATDLDVRWIRAASYINIGTWRRIAASVQATVVQCSFMEAVFRFRAGDGEKRCGARIEVEGLGFATVCEPAVVSKPAAASASAAASQSDAASAPAAATINV